MQSVMPSQPSCTLCKYRVKRFLFEEQRDASATTALAVVPDVSFQPDSKSYRTLLRCDYATGKTLFQAIIEGEFEFKELINQTNAMHAWVNGGTVLYGILRSLYSIASSQCTGTTDILPTVMMVDCVKQRIEQLIAKANEEKAKKTTSNAEKQS